jgi:hypothetical protein
VVFVDNNEDLLILDHDMRKGSDKSGNRLQREHGERSILKLSDRSHRKEKSSSSPNDQRQLDDEPSERQIANQVTLDPSGSEKDGQKSNNKGGERSGISSFTTKVKEGKDNEVVEGDGEDHDDDDEQK